MGVQPTAVQKLVVLCAAYGPIGCIAESEKLPPPPLSTTALGTSRYLSRPSSSLSLFLADDPQLLRNRLTVSLTPRLSTLSSLTINGENSTHGLIEFLLAPAPPTIGKVNILEVDRDKNEQTLLISGSCTIGRFEKSHSTSSDTFTDTYDQISISIPSMLGVFNVTLCQHVDQSGTPVSRQLACQSSFAPSDMGRLLGWKPWDTFHFSRLEFDSLENDRLVLSGTSELVIEFLRSCPTTTPEQLESFSFFAQAVGEWKDKDICLQSTQKPSGARLPSTVTDPKMQAVWRDLIGLNTDEMVYIFIPARTSDAPSTAFRVLGIVDDFAIIVNHFKGDLAVEGVDIDPEYGIQAISLAALASVTKKCPTIVPPCISLGLNHRPVSVYMNAAITPVIWDGLQAADRLICGVEESWGFPSGTLRLVLKDGIFVIKETAYRESRDVLTISPEWFDAGDIPTFDIRYRALAGIMNLLDLPKLTTATEAVLLRTLVTKIYDYEPDTYSTIENSYALVILLAEQPWETAKRMKSLSSKDRNTLRRIMSDAQKGLEMYNPTIGKVLSELSSTMHQGMIRK